MCPNDLSNPLPSKRLQRNRVVVAVIWLSLMTILLVGGLYSDLTAERAAGLVRDAGFLGMACYLLAFALLQPLGLSGHLLTITAALIWDWPIAIPLALSGAVGSAIVSFLIARYVAFDWVQARLPARLKRYEGWLVERGLWGVVGFRVLTFTMQPALLMMGTLRIGFPTMLVGTIIGFAPQICVDVLLGGEFVRFLMDALGIS